MPQRTTSARRSYIGRLLFVWAILYLTFFIGTERRVVRGILFHDLRRRRPMPASSSARWLALLVWHAASPAVPHALLGMGRHRRHSSCSFRFSVCAKARPGVGQHRLRHRAAVVQRLLVEHFDNGIRIPPGPTLSRTSPRMLSSRAFCVFLIWWGVTQASRGLVNLGTVFFGAPSHGSTSAISSTRWAARSASSASACSSSPAVGYLRKPAVACSRTCSNHPLPRGGAMTFSKASIVLLVLQLMIVSTVAAKYLYQRAHLPACLDARCRLRSSTRDARPLPQPATLRWMDAAAHCPRPGTREFTRDINGVPNGKDFSIRSANTVWFQAKLAVKDQKLIAIRVPESDASIADPDVAARSRCILRPDAPLRAGRFLYSRARHRSHKAQARPATVDRSDRAAQRPAPPAPTGAKRQRRMEAARISVEIEEHPDE